jgi:hypothetical protein
MVAVIAIIGLSVALAGPTIVVDPTSILTLAIAALHGAVGALLAVRRPRNPIGWIFLGVLLVFVVSTAAGAFGGTDLEAGGPLPGGLPLALIWIETWAFQLMFGLYYALTVVFPSGRLPGGRIGLAVRASFLVPAAGVFVSATGPHLAGIYAPEGVGRAIDNPLALFPFPDDLFGPFYLGTVSLLIGGVVSMLVRFRRARGIERQQLKWLVAALVLTGALVLWVVVIIDIAPGPYVGKEVWAIALVGYGAIPPAVAIAVLRYRLYEIDRIVSRTIGWAVVSAVLGAVFAVVILVAQAALSSITESNTLAVAASTLVVAALFQPLRRRIQALVDQRFNRSRYGADLAVAAFVGQLRQSVDVEQLRGELATTVATTVQPASTVIWLRR